MNQQQHFTPEMTVDEAFKLHAGARRVFARFHLGGCSNCAISESHTIGAISDDYGIPLPMLLENLNALFDQRTLSVGDRVRIPDEIRSKIPQLANVVEIGEITGAEGGAYTADFGDVRLQGLAEDLSPSPLKSQLARKAQIWLSSRRRGVTFAMAIEPRADNE